jgi:hypothetical protein
LRTVLINTDQQFSRSITIFSRTSRATAFRKAVTRNEVLLGAYSVEKLFWHHFRQNFWGHQTPNLAALVDCRAFYEVSVFEAMIFEFPQRVFQQKYANEAELQLDIPFYLRQDAPMIHFLNLFFRVLCMETSW